jgi:hypothetical protein
MSETNPTPDPAAAAVIAKAKRLMLITTGATFLALAIVLVVVGYRVSGLGGSAAVTPDVTVQLPKDARVVSTTMADGKLLVTVEVGGKPEVRLFDAKTGKAMGRVLFGVE